MLSLPTRLGLAAAGGAAVIVGGALLIPNGIEYLQTLPVPTLSHFNVHAVAYGIALACAGAILLALVRLSRPNTGFSLSTAALVGAGVTSDGLRVTISDSAVDKIVRASAYRTQGILGCRPRPRLNRRGWTIAADLQVHPTADVATVSAAFEAGVRQALTAQTHMEVGEIRIYATFEPVESDRLR